MTASVLNQDPRKEKVQKNAITVLGQNTAHANFQGNPLYQYVSPAPVVTATKFN